MKAWYSPADMVAKTLPWTITWDWLSPVGFNSMGFMWTDGGSPAASACSACALPISPPSCATAEFNAMFCALNGATLNPLFLRHLMSAAVRTLFPTCEEVPWSIMFLTFPIEFQIAVMLKSPWMDWPCTWQHPPAL